MFQKIFKAIKNNIIFAWLVPYLIITLLPMVCNGIIYSRAKTALKNELTINSTQALDKFKISVENILVNVTNIANNLQEDDNVLALNSMPAGVEYEACIGDALAVSKKFQGLLSANPALSEIYVFYKDIDVVTSSHYMYTKGAFYEQKLKNSDLDYNSWVAMFDENCYAVPKVITFGDGARQTVDIMYQIPAYLDNFDSVVVISIDRDVLLNNAKMVTDLYSDVGMFILSKDGEVLMTNGVVDSIPEPSNDCTVLNVASDTSGWRYVLVIPSQIFERRLSYFKWINLSYILICLLICGLLSFYFAKRNLRPFSMLKKIYNKDDDNDSSLINNMLNDYRSAKLTKAELEQSQLMEELITSGQPIILDELREYGIDFKDQYFCVILFKLINVSKLFEDENDVTTLQKYDSVKLIIKNVLEEIINEKHNAYICKINGQIVAVVNINHDFILDFQTDLEQMLSSGREFISSRFAFSFTPFIGGIHDAKSLHKSYSEALNALQYRTFIPTTEIVFCEDNGEATPQDVATIIPAEKAKQLVSLLQLGDADTSLSMVNTLLRMAPHDSPVKYRVFLFDLISTLIRAFESSDMGDIEIKLSAELCNLTGDCDPAIIPQKLNEIITEFCRLRSINKVETEEKETEKNISKKDMVSEIKRFITENYTDQALNIAMVGDYFNITPYYVSNIFKKSEDVSMLDYISMTRINKAKELLVTTDLNLESIALQCGFSNIRTFMRVFQKFEIITPGKYKELNKK